MRVLSCATFLIIIIVFNNHAFDSQMLLGHKLQGLWDKFDAVVPELATCHHTHPVTHYYIYVTCSNTTGCGGWESSLIECSSRPSIKSFVFGPPSRSYILGLNSGLGV